MYCKRYKNHDCDACGKCLSEPSVVGFCYCYGEAIKSGEQHSQIEGVFYCEKCNDEKEC